jgi:predicted PurR-regulated permease PerM
MTESRPDLTRNTLAILCIFGLIGLSLWVLRPFLAATVWAVMIVVATWPLFAGLEARLGGRRLPAIVLMTLGMLLLLVLPLWLVIGTISEHADQLAALLKSATSSGLLLPPDWVSALPLVGKKLAVAWKQLAAGGAAGLVTKLTPYAADTGKLALSWMGDLSAMLLQFFLVIIIAAIFYVGGEAGARLARNFGRRLAGERGENSIILAGQAIRGVALGVGVTAVVQTVLGGIGLAIAGVPFATLLSAVMLMFCIAQAGPSLVLLPAVGWLYWTGAAGWASFLLVWSLIVISLDNFLRPMLIKRGADLPLLLIFAGVIGGMLSFGLIGLFIGPVVLAVTYTLLLAWIDEAPGWEIPGGEVTAPLEAAAASVFAQTDQAEPPAG